MTRSAYIYSDMTDYCGVVGQSDVFGLVVWRGASVQIVCGRRRGPLVYNKGAFDVDLDAARVVDGAVDFGCCRRCPRPPNLLCSVLSGDNCGRMVAVLRQGQRKGVGHGCGFAWTNVSWR